MESYVISSLFEKEHSNSSFFNELLKKDKNEKWLQEALRSEYIDINHQDEDGNTFLINCLKAKKFQSVEWLIKHGADISIKNKQRKTALHIAVEKNSLPVVKGLLEFGVIDINERDIDGRTLLQNVVVFGNIKMAKLLIAYGADINNVDAQGRNILYDALSFGDTNFIEYLLNLEILHRNLIYNDQTTIFEHPEILKNTTIIPLLIEYGVDPNIKNHQNQTVYERLNDMILSHYTSNNLPQYKNAFALLELIISHDTHRDHNYLDSNGYPLFFKPLIFNHLKLFELYLTNDFDHTMQDTLGRTLIHTAVWNNNQKVIQKIDLCDKELKNTPDIYNIIPLFYAALLGNQSLSILFLQLGSNISSNRPIAKKAIKKFHPMLKNLPKLQIGLEDEVLIEQIDALILQIQKEFKKGLSVK